MKLTLRLWEIFGCLQIAITIICLIDRGYGSVLPRPSIRQRSTTQVASVTLGSPHDKYKNYSDEGTIVVVTSSELPKQIPPPPTPTRPHEPTPKFDVGPRDSFYMSHKSDVYNKMFTTS